MRTLLSLVATFSFVLPFSASAAIMGMLAESESTQVDLATLPVAKDYVVKIAVISDRKIEVLYFSRYLGGQGGNVADILAALQQGKLPSPPTVGSWMGEDQTAPPSEKIGIFDSPSSFSFVSAFTGQPTVVPHTHSLRLSIEQLPDGRFKQIFALGFPYAVNDEALETLKAGKMNVTLVTQAREPGAFDTSLKRTLELPALLFLGTSGCAPLLQ